VASPETPVARPAGRRSRAVKRNGTVKLRKLIIAGGRADGLEPADIVHVLTAAGGLDGEGVRNVRVLEHFTFAEVPEADADRVIAAASGTDIRGHALALEAARG
jgi:ATP-dependent RNA helicase DeaD